MKKLCWTAICNKYFNKYTHELVYVAVSCTWDAEITSEISFFSTCTAQMEEQKRLTHWQLPWREAQRLLFCS